MASLAFFLKTRKEEGGIRVAAAVGFASLSLFLCALFVFGVYFYTAKTDNRTLFAQQLGMEPTADVVVHKLSKSGIGDHLDFSVCFDASVSTIEKIVAQRELEVIRDRPLNHDGLVQAQSCVGDEGVYYERVLSGGSNGERVNGFGMTEQLLAYDKQSRRAFYSFKGLD